MVRNWAGSLTTAVSALGIVLLHVDKLIVTGSSKREAGFLVKEVGCVVGGDAVELE